MPAKPQPKKAQPRRAKPAVTEFDNGAVVITEPAEPVTAAQAAVDEAEGKPVVFEFRGQKFAIPRAIFDSARVHAVIARGSSFDLVRECLAADPENYDRFLSVVKLGETREVPIAEFFEAVNAAAGSGNSSTS